MAPVHVLTLCLLPSPLTAQAILPPSFPPSMNSSHYSLSSPAHCQGHTVFPFILLTVQATLLSPFSFSLPRSHCFPLSPAHCPGHTVFSFLLLTDQFTLSLPSPSHCPGHTASSFLPFNDPVGGGHLCLSKWQIDVHGGSGERKNLGAVSLILVWGVHCKNSV